MEISKRKLESYKRAERVSRELRYQLSNTSTRNQIDFNILFKLVSEWMDKTGKIKYERPS